MLPTKTGGDGLRGTMGVGGRWAASAAHLQPVGERKNEDIYFYFALLNRLIEPSDSGANIGKSLYARICESS